MNDEKSAIDELREVLRSFVEKSFPKKCKCGKLYEDLDHFLTETQEADYPSNLLQLMGYRDQALTGLARECECGGPLVVIINDRRDRTSEGARVRRDFGRLLYVLEQAGMEPEVARQELLDVLSGKESTNITGHELEMVNRLKSAWQDIHRRPAWRDLPPAEQAPSPLPPREPAPEPEDVGSPEETESEELPLDSASPEPTPPQGAAPKKCSGTTKAGTPCKLFAFHGSDYCHMHQPKE